MATAKKAPPAVKKSRVNKKTQPTFENPNPIDYDLHGRVTKYRPEYDQQGFKLALLGYTQKDISDFWDIDITTLNRWMNSYPSLDKAIRAGGVEADAEVVASLYQQAKGFEIEVEEVKVVGVAVGVQEVEKVRTKRYIPPNFAAAARWLGNRQRSRWADKSEGPSDPQSAALAAQAALKAIDAVVEPPSEGEAE